MKVRSDPPTRTIRKAIDEGRERGRVAAQRREDGGDDLANVAAQDLFDVGIEQQDDEEDAADDRNAEDQLERRLGDELHDDERPVGGGDERTALQGRLQCRSVKPSTHSQFTFAVSCLTSGSALPSCAGRRTLRPAAPRMSQHGSAGAACWSPASWRPRLTGVAGVVPRALVVRSDRRDGCRACRGARPAASSTG